MSGQPEELVGQVLGDTYEVAERLGRGGMGAVYLARHRRTGRRYALKVLLPRLSTDPEALGRFRREAETVGRLGHPGIVGVHDFDQTDSGLTYIVMDHLEGEDLDARLRRLRGAGLDFEESFSIFEQVGSALSAAHELGIVHRDLKPANIFLARSAQGERAVILDFGLAKVMNPEPAMTQLTMTGVVMGTPQYMSPEQANGTGVDHRTDLYSLAAVFYEMLTNQPPLQASTLPVLFAKLLNDAPPPLSERCQKALPVGIDDVISRALSKDPEARHGSARQLVDAVRALGAPAEGTTKGFGAPGALEESLDAAPTLVSAVGQDLIQTAPEVASPEGGPQQGHSPARRPDAWPQPFPAPESLARTTPPEPAGRPAPEARRRGPLRSCLIVALVVLGLFVSCTLSLTFCAALRANRQERQGDDSPTLEADSHEAEPLAPEGGVTEPALPPVTDGYPPTGEPPTVEPPPVEPPDSPPLEASSGELYRRADDLLRQGRPHKCLPVIKQAGTSRPVLALRFKCARAARNPMEVANACRLLAIHQPGHELLGECARLIKRRRFR